MIVNGSSLLKAKPIKDMVDTKVIDLGVSFGLGEAGYDIRIKQKIEFRNFKHEGRLVFSDGEFHRRGKFALASTLEEFQMPDYLVGIVHDKSTWARQGLSVFNTVLEPGWNGYLTIELAYHGDGDLIIPAGSGIAQVVFHETTDRARYEGKYQNQEDKPVQAIPSTR